MLPCCCRTDATRVLLCAGSRQRRHATNSLACAVRGHLGGQPIPRRAHCERSALPERQHAALTLLRYLRQACSGAAPCSFVHLGHVFLGRTCSGVSHYQHRRLGWQVQPRQRSFGLQTDHYQSRLRSHRSGSTVEVPLGSARGRLPHLLRTRPQARRSLRRGRPTRRTATPLLLEPAASKARRFPRL